MIIRDIWKNLQQELFNDNVVVITGPRQVGKTTTLQWLLSQINSQNKYYFDLENIVNRDLFGVKDYDTLLAKFRSLGLNTLEKMYIAIDEIQAVKNLPSIIKYLHDHYDIKFVLTGSSSYYLKNLFSQSLAGRKVIYELFPLSFGEFLKFKNEKFKLPKFNVYENFSNFTYEKLRVLYDEYIEYGGLPKVVQVGSLKEKQQQLEMIFSSYINLDVQSLSDFRSLKDFRKLVQLLSERVGNKLNTTKLATILGISRQTVSTYLEFMEQTYLIRLIQPFSGSSDVRARVSPKLYFVDTGIASINYELSAGAKFENTVCHQLYLQSKSYAFGRKINYFSNETAEVDFIVNNDLAFEVKETPLKSDLIKLIKISKKIKLKKYRLIGRKKPAEFSDFLWGGMIP